MFRNPRENRKLPPTSKIAPSVGRPPSPPHSNPSTGTMAPKPASKTAMSKQKSTSGQPSKLQTTLVDPNWAKKSPANNGFKGKPKAPPNGNIMSFFKKAEEINNRLFLQDTKSRGTIVLSDAEEEDGDVDWKCENSGQDRYNENTASVKRRKVGSEELPLRACSPPPPANGAALALTTPPKDAVRPAPARRKTGPFVDESDSEVEDDVLPPPRRSLPDASKPFSELTGFSSLNVLPPPAQVESESFPAPDLPPLLKAESASQFGGGDFEGFEDLEDEDMPEGEEYDERRWMQEQQRLEMAEAGFEGDFDDFEEMSMFPESQLNDTGNFDAKGGPSASCPICEASLAGLTDQQSLVHVNGCLDGKPVPLPPPKDLETSTKSTLNSNSKMFKRPPRPAKAGQENPFQLGQASTGPKSAFSTLMAGHAEDRAWATAAAEQAKARGKPAYQRTCPFYKIMPGFFIAVDAFRYGAVKGQNAYFLSHFHSDHYIGLTSSWSHGPIYCSKVTANLVRQQLRVDPKWVVDLEFEAKTEVPGTQGVHVTMIPANHCPGSSLFLFEKEIGKSKNPKLQRVLHCGDFRACRAHVEHPLLRPDVLDAVSGKNKQQKLDACYLDTTYLNPKYAFPPQQQVIQACADMCVSLNKVRTDESDGWEQMKRERAGEGMVKFVHKGSDIKKEGEGEEAGSEVEEQSPTKASSGVMRGRLLVVVGTYSIGKERICVGIAKALGSKIFAAKGKTRICHALEDPELNSLLTSDPREAQVHMTPLFEIRGDTLDDYLRDYSDYFSRAVGFRPSGWNYRPPNSRFTESPSVQTVLHSQNWKSQFSMRDLTPQRGSTSRASCFGVPYSEHSSFRELTMFCCALRIDKIIPTVNVGSAKSREKMKSWCERWALDKKKNGLFKLENGDGW